MLKHSLIVRNTSKDIIRNGFLFLDLSRTNDSAMITKCANSFLHSMKKLIINLLKDQIKSKVENITKESIGTAKYE